MSISLDPDLAQCFVQTVCKVYQKNASENVICLGHLLHIFATIMINVSVEVNSVDPDQIAPTGWVYTVCQRSF